MIERDVTSVVDDLLDDGFTILEYSEDTYDALKAVDADLSAHGLEIELIAEHEQSYAYRIVSKT